MFHLANRNSATEFSTKFELRKLLEKARQNNVKLGLTGMVLYNFMQVLKGTEEVVTKLASTIERGPGHEGIIVLLRGKSEQCLFRDWSMGLRDLVDQNAAKTPGYTNFMDAQKEHVALTSWQFCRVASRSNWTERCPVSSLQ